MASQILNFRSDLASAISVIHFLALYSNLREKKCLTYIGTEGYVLVVMHLKMRRIEIAGATPHPNSEWMQQVGRNLTDCVDGFFRSSTHVILDRDTKHLPLRQILKSSDIEAGVLPPKSPNLNAHLERFMRSLKSECLNRMIFFGEASLRRALREFGEHFHHERHHQELANRIIDAGDEVGRKDGELSCRPRLGGLLRYYYRDAA